MSQIRHAGTIFAIAIFAAIPSFAQTSRNADVNLPEIQCNTVTDGFCDVTLAVEQQTTQADGSLLLRVAGTYKNQRLALQIAIAPGMKPGAMNPITGGPQAYSAQRGGIRWLRSDEGSDRFVARLAELYHTKAKPKGMTNDIHFTAFAFRGDPEKLSSHEVLFELYHDDPANQVPQCVVLLDVNLPGKKVSIREKDQDFRDCIVGVLGEME